MTLGAPASEESTQESWGGGSDMCQKREWVECYEDQNLHPQSPHKSLVRHPACVILTEKLGEADGQLACVDIGENRPT